MPLAELQRELSQGLEFLKLVRGVGGREQKKGLGTCFCFLDGPMPLLRIKKRNPKAKIRIDCEYLGDLIKPWIN